MCRLRLFINNTYILALCSLIFSFSAEASDTKSSEGVVSNPDQIVPMAPLQHNLQVYRDISTNRLFWPKDLPVFVRLATSPDPGAETHLLDNMLKVQGNTRQLQSNFNIDLEVTGNQFIRWFNSQTKDTLYLQFHSDGLSPISDIIYSGAEQFRRDNITYFGPGLKVDISSTDQHSGVDERFISVNRSNFRGITNPVPVQREQLTEIWYYAVDNVGNVETPRRAEFMVDLSQPTSYHEINGINEDVVLASSSTFSLFSRDFLSGVREIRYSLTGNGSILTYNNSPIKLSDLEDGQYNLTYYALDNVGNMEERKVIPFYVDRIPPVPSIRAEGDIYRRDGISFVSPRTSFTITAEDNRAGVASIRYAVNGQSQGTYQIPFRLAGLTGSKEVAYVATDRVQNVSREYSDTFMMDASRPLTMLNFNGPVHAERNVFWISGSTTMSLKAADDGSGIKETLYRIGNEGSFTRYASPVRIDDEGRVEFFYYSVDNVNNEEGELSARLHVDTTAPTVISNFNSTPSRVVPKEDEGTVNVYVPGSRLILQAIDELSGVERITYAINDGIAEVYNQPVAFSKPGSYVVTVNAVDFVGNQARMKMEFIIE